MVTRNDGHMHVEQLKNQIEPLREKIIHHPLYEAIQTIEDLRIFMEHHVFAVWDFMSLLKSLQNHLTCTQVPWFPVGDAATRFFINEIVIGEESDVDPSGDNISHFELYCKAMQHCGASTDKIERFVALIKAGKPISHSLEEIATGEGIANFVNGTFETIATGKVHLIAAVFTFGREELIPDMFYSLVKDLSNKFPERVALFKYYLERHIEIDGGHHAKLAYQMTENLCGDVEKSWIEAQSAVTKALQNRLALWDAAFAEIQRNKLSSHQKMNG